MKKLCETTGVPKAMLRKAIKYWEKERKRFGLTLDSFPPVAKVHVAATELSYVAALPPPPRPGTPEYNRCINYWHMCMMQAQYLDGYRNQVAQINQQITYAEINLTAYLESYASCIGGIFV